MKVVHLCHSDEGSGAGRAAFKIHSSLANVNIDTKLLVAEKRTEDKNTIQLFDSVFSRKRQRIVEYMEHKFGKVVSKPQVPIFSQGLFPFLKLEKNVYVKEADIVIAYWLNGSFVNPEQLGALQKPIIWRLSDAWPFTGGCHYFGDCEGFKKDCGFCPQLKFPSKHDFSRRLLSRKRKSWKQSDLTIVAPSNWMSKQVKESSLFSSRRVEVIHTGVNTRVFHPLDKEFARKYWGITTSKRVLLFGSADFEKDNRKGFKIFLNALQELKKSGQGDQYHALLFGSEEVDLSAFPIEVTSLGYLNHDDDLNIAYNCADILVVPSIDDNLPNVALEGLASSTVIVGFDRAGMSEVIQHMKTGFSIKEVSPRALAEGIDFIFKNEVLLQTMRRNARNLALSEFSLEKQADNYLTLLNELVKETVSQ